MIDKKAVPNDRPSYVSSWITTNRTATDASAADMAIGDGRPLKGRAHHDRPADR